ncbi:uncharacterized protein LTR77_006195 [Saxophila tyrrhenica]|uniref:Uncharacterized protein n=1 Tax=Saxophila tyrrhenica TaxID=1690608 RepID=A0AAV9P777_9PEZI|nr:hypothetical protein LTR77_006195 [Saxophila tyrrhenica]
MISFHRSLIFLWVFISALASAQTTKGSTGYVGYDLDLEGDSDSVIFSTDETRPNAGANFPNPDVYLNASVHVGTIDIQVDNLTAKINLDAQVLNLLQFNAGVDLSIDSVRLLIEKVRAKVLLEVRLENLVKMINTTLSSIDLNPIIAELGEGIGDVLNSTGDAVGGLTGSDSSSSLAKRGLSYELEHGILYSTNNYRNNKHTNQVLAQNGDIVAERLDNDGNELGSRVVGNYKNDMSFNGYEIKVRRDGEEVTEREYVYSPHTGVTAICAIYTNAAGEVVGTQIIAESSAGGSSTIGED